MIVVVVWKKQAIHIYILPFFVSLNIVLYYSWIFYVCSLSSRSGWRYIVVGSTVVVVVVGGATVVIGSSNASPFIIEGGIDKN